MKMRNTLITLSLFFLGGFCSCKSFKQPDFKGIENVRLSRLGLNESTLKLDLVYYNPNKSKLNLKYAQGDAWVDGNLLGHFTMDTLIKIQSLSDFKLPVNLQINMKRFLQNSALLLLKTEVTLKVEGKAKVGKGSFYLNYPIKYEGKQRTDSLMKLQEQLNNKQ